MIFRSVLVAFSMMSAMLFLGSPVGAQEVEREIARQYAVQADQFLHLRLRFGALVVEGHDGDLVEVASTIRCSGDCQNAVDRIDLEATSRSDQLIVTMKGAAKGVFRRLNISNRVLVPRGVALEVDMQSGDVEVSGIGEDIEIDITNGDATVRMLEPDVGTVELDVTAGSAVVYKDGDEIRAQGRLGRSLEWKGDGEAYVEIDIAVGDARVHIDPP